MTMFGRKKKTDAAATTPAASSGSHAATPGQTGPEDPSTGPSTGRFGVVTRHPDRGGAPILSFEDVAVTFDTEFGDVEAVKGVTFDIKPGEVVALVGESGSGKSVTSATAMGLLPGNANITGTVTLGDRNVTALDSNGLRRIRGRHVAMVFQEPMTALNPVLTVGDQLTEALNLHGIAFGTDADQRAVELLTMVGIPDAKNRLKQYPHQFSGGQRQRIVIAMAITMR